MHIRLPTIYPTGDEAIWEAILTWVKSKQEKHEWEKLKMNNSLWAGVITSEEKMEIQAMEMILHWVKYYGKEALEEAESILKRRRARHRPKPIGIKLHIQQLLEFKLMERMYQHTQLTPLAVPEPVCSRSKEIFITMLEEIPKLMGMHARWHQFRILELQCPKVVAFEAQLSLDKILRLSSWSPFSTQNKHLHELLRSALLMLNDLSGNERYHDDLRDFIKQHSDFCAFTLDNAYDIHTESSKTKAELRKNLRRLAQNLGEIASTKADQYQKLYENFIAHKEDLSHWLDSASPGQGRSLVNSFTDSLKGMASSMRGEANFWKSQSNQFHKWPDTRETYSCAINVMPPFPSEQLNNHRSSTTPSTHASASGSVAQNTETGSQSCMPQAAQQVLATFANLQKLRVNTTQAFLVKFEDSISKGMRETRGYLEFVVDVAEKQLSQPSEGCVPKVIAQLAEKALCITKRWDKLHRKVKYWGSILSIFSKPLAYQTFDMISGISRDDFLDRVIASPDTLIHPYVIEFELCLRDMWHHFLSRTHFWAHVDSDPDTFTSWRLAFLNEI